MTDQELLDHIEQEILTLSLGHTFEISNYATSRHQEAVYKKKGLEQVRRVANRLATFVREQQLVILDQVRMEKVPPAELGRMLRTDGYNAAITDLNQRIDKLKAELERK